jgi:streptomycin 6-kinase
MIQRVVPELVRRKALHLGAAGERWLAGLPALVADVARQWSITIGESLHGGSASFVARARTFDGRGVVLKLVLPGHEVVGQVEALRAADGLGYVRLHAADVPRGALLLEALGKPIDLPPEPTMVVLARMLRQAWQVPRGGGPVPDKAGALGAMVDRLWHSHGRPCSARVHAVALEFARRRALFDPALSVVVHGDPHPGNVLRVLSPRPGAETGYVFVDPDGFPGDPAYDLGVVLREWCAPLLAADDAPALARRYCALLAAESGLDETAIWEWGFLERVSTGLYLLDFGATSLGGRYLRTAELLAS